MATELGQAYVQIMPSAKGIGSTISKQLDPESTAAGKSAGGNIASAIKKVIIAAGIGKAIVGAINLGGELQQNLGGSEAVFGKYATKIQDTASNAYKNMGMSASEYMGTANKMGSLFQGSGLSQQKALDMTSSAMQRAADVASVMGLDTSAAMESIAGAAKGNFTMMDNLGVSMNATTLQAYALEKGMNFDWKTASNAEKSELAMKMFMDRTSQYAGNFAKESEQTFSGSLGAMKSSFKDVLATMSTGGDMGPALEGLTSSIVSFAGNLFPMISSTLSGLPTMILKILSEAGPSLVTGGLEMIASLLTGWGNGMPEMMTTIVTTLLAIVQGIVDNIPILIQGAVTLIRGLAVGITQALPILLEQLPILINSIITVLLASLPLIISAGIQLLTGLVGAMPQIIEAIVLVLPQIIDGILQAITLALPLLIAAGIQLLTSLVNDLPTIIAAIVQVLPLIVNSITAALTENIPLIVAAGIQLITALVKALPEIIAAIVKVLPQIIDAMIKLFIGNLPLIINAGVELLTALIDNMPTIIKVISDALPTIINSIIQVLLANLPLIIQAGVSLLTALISNMPVILATLVGAMPQIISSIVTTLINSVPQFINIGVQLLAGLGQGIANAVGGVIKKAKQVASDIVDGIKGFFGIKSPSRVFMGIGEYLDAGLAKGIAGNIKPVTKAMDKIEAATSRSLESDIAFNTTSPGALKGLSASISSGLIVDQASQDYDRKILREILMVMQAIEKKNQNILLDGDKLVGGVIDRLDEKTGFKSREATLAYGG